MGPSLHAPNWPSPGWSLLQADSGPCSLLEAPRDLASPAGALGYGERGPWVGQVDAARAPTLVPKGGSTGDSRAAGEEQADTQPPR